MHVELYANNEAMKILLVFIFLHYIWFINSDENLCFILILKEKMTSS